jgi:peptidyl-prolyl cis-trans isomerase B (cyclophilin B)
MTGRITATAGAAVVGLGLLTGCGSSSGGDSSTVNAPPSAATSSAASSAASSPCKPVPTHDRTPQHFSKEPAVTIARATYSMRVVTNCGTVVVALDGAKAPHTVNSFAFLAGHHFFDGTQCHRLTTSGIFVLQCGDPSGTGSGGPGYTIPDENLSGATYPAGTVAMANTGQPHTGGSQFFFVYADTQLPPQYTPFGHVTQGLAVLKAIAAAGEDDSNGPGDGKPRVPVVISSFTVKRGG